MSACRITFNPGSIEDYERFLRVKSLPKYRMRGSRAAEIPAEYAAAFGVAAERADSRYAPRPWLYDYQRDIAALAVRKRKFAGFIDCGLGKTAIMFEFARHATAQLAPDRATLIVAPLMVIPQHVAELEKFYGREMPIDVIESRDLQAWLARGTGRVGIVNYDALGDDIQPGRLGSLVLDESSMLKSHYGKWGTTCVRLGRGLDWKLALTGTPAPNDRIEYGNHAVFCDQFPTINSFLARYFVNRGKTDNRWELKPHALRPFYASLSHWSIFLTNPATYGWQDNCGTVPPIHVHIHDVPLSGRQRDEAEKLTGGTLTGEPIKAGGITSRAVLSQLAKGSFKGESVETLKPDYIRRLVDSWPDESTIIWCRFNGEQESLARLFPGAANVSGDTPHAERARLIADFQGGRRRQLITKTKILGFGLNLQVATRHVWSGLQDSYEEFYQGVKRSNRIGSTRDLNVHIPITEIERPMVETVLAKAKRVQADTEEQERMFKQHAAA